jgi:hypothetical protein
MALKDKIVLLAQEIAADVKTLLAHAANTSNPHSVDKTDVGLGNVPNVDATDVDNHSSGTTNKVYTAAEQTKVGFISVTQAVDLDAMESDIATNTAKVGVTTEISDVVEDLTPQLGGDLDPNGFGIGATRELLTFVEDASAVNHLEIENEATGGGPILRATGDDADVDLTLETKGDGRINLADHVYVKDSRAITAADSSALNIDADWTGVGGSFYRKGVFLDLNSTGSNANVLGLDFNYNVTGTNSKGEFIRGVASNNGRLGSTMVDLSTTNTEILFTSYSTYFNKQVQNWTGITNSDRYNQKVYGLYNEINVDTAWNSAANVNKPEFYGLWSQIDTPSSTNTTEYGLYLNSVNGGTDDFGVYSLGNGANIFEGNVGIGRLTASYPLHVQGWIVNAQDGIRTRTGTAAEPAHGFIDDIDMGMYRITTNTIGFSTGAAERMSINGSGDVKVSTGNLGIGRDPTETLDVYASSHATLKLESDTGDAILTLNSNNGSGDQPEIWFRRNSGATMTFRTLAASDDTELTTFSNTQELQLQTSGGLTSMGGGVAYTTTTSAAGNYTVLVTDKVIFKSGITGGGDTVTLPSGAATGQVFIIKDSGGNASTDSITIATAGAETIDGVSTYSIRQDYQSVTVIFDGTNYNII